MLCYIFQDLFDASEVFPAALDDLIDRLLKLLLACRVAALSLV